MSNRLLNTRSKWIIAFVVVAFEVITLAYIQAAKNKQKFVPITGFMHYVPAPSISQKNYPEVTFLSEQITIEPSDFQKDEWIVWTSSTTPFHIQYPKDWKAKTYDSMIVGFCKPNSCQDYYPEVILTKNKTKEDVFSQLAGCAPKDCYGINIAVSPIAIGQIEGQVWWTDRLTFEEVRTQKDTNSKVVPPVGEKGTIVFEYNNDVYQLHFDLSDPIQRKMLSSLAFKE